MKKNYKSTMCACFTGYIVQAIINNFAPLLFVTFQKTFDIPLSQITALITVNFVIQLLIDLLSAGFIDKIGYRASAVLSHVFAAVGLILLTVLPEVFASPFVGLLIAVIIYAVGGGLLEVLVSPIMEACPTENKEKAMSLLHSFYCWGHMAVVLLSTLFFTAFGISNWRILAIFWALIPIVNAIFFTQVPIYSLQEEGEKGLTLKELCRNKVFWLMMIMMVCSGASERAVSQWASTFAPQMLTPIMSYRLRFMRIFCRRIMAGHVQQIFCSNQKRRNCYVCNVGSCGRSRMLRRSYSCRFGFGKL